MNRCRVLWTALLLAALTSIATAQSVLNFQPSPQANGRGGIYPSGNTDDPLAPLSNPALLGLMAERYSLLSAFYPQHATFQPLFDPSMEMGYSSRALYFGLSRADIAKRFDWQSSFSFGIGYQEATLDYGDVPQVDENGNRIGTHDSYETTRGFSVAVGFHRPRWHAGLGFSHSWARTNFSFGRTDMTPSSLGLFAESFVEEWFPASGMTYLSPRMRLQPFLHLSSGYALRNYGPEFRWSFTDRRSPLPRTAKLSLGFSTGLSAEHPVARKWELLSVSAGIEAEDDLVNYVGPSGWEYEHPLGDIHPIKHLILGQTDPDMALRKGYEIGILETLYLRGGRPIDPFIYSDSHGTTSGYGLRLAGMLKLMTWSTTAPADPTLRFVLEHLDLQYDHASLEEPGDWMDGTTFNQLSLRLRY